MTLILHVEDDIVLGALVAMSFERLGFHGTTVAARTLKEGERVLDAAARTGDRFDLIISDLNLPDGTGLDLVRHVRASAEWKTTPMLILSGDLDPKAVGRAYALGANAYISKSPPGRTLVQVVTALYQHWIVDVVSPPLLAHDHARGAIERAIGIRFRHARLYQRLTEKFADDHSESAFWLSRALGESNLVNLLGFVQSQLTNQGVEDLSSEVAQMQATTERALTALEIELDHGALSRDDIYLRVLQLFSVQNIDVVARSMGQLFPVSPVAVAVLRDFLLGIIQDLSAWIELHASVPAIRELAVDLRDAATRLGAVEPGRSSHAPT